MSTTVDSRAQLLTELREHAVLHGDFVLSSGQHSNVYLDARLVTLSARGSGLVGRVLLQAMADHQVDAVAGLAVGADPIVTAVAVIAGQNGQAIDALIVRKERKAHGAGKQIEGPWRAGMRVAIVEDTVTTGASLLQAAQAVTDAGGVVVGAWGLIDRNAGGRENVEAAGYQFRAVFSADELLT